MKRKIIAALFALVILLNVSIIVTAASDLVETDAAAEADPIATEEVNTTASTEETTAPTIASRLWEAWESGDIQDIAVIAWGVISTIFMFVLKNAGSVNAIATRTEIKNNNAVATAKMNEIVGGLNAFGEDMKEAAKTIFEECDKLRGEMESMKLSDDEMIKGLAARVECCASAVSAFASMMQAIYSNSKTIPQSVKDIVNSRYMEVVNSLTVAEDEKHEG